jgi:arsenate reductase (glutaredoxin)
MIIVYGITNCQTVQKARKWLEEKGLEYSFWDYKKHGIDTAHLEKWCDTLGWEKVLNRAGMMWRKASDGDKAQVVDQATAIQFMIKVPTSIKRPIVEVDGKLLLGFDEEKYTAQLS